MKLTKKIWYCVVSCFYDDGHTTAAIVDTKEVSEKPESGWKSLRNKDVYTDWYETKEEAEQAVRDARTA